MKQGLFEIAGNEKLAKDVYQMTPMAILGPFPPPTVCQPQLTGLYLRRPISVCDWDEKP